ncbi:hypothetical protein QE152_g21812 [Popillia japonica]|uniref:Uncharacterized protein n=1 Tax=Popillia japonica TaxID=7064 RepID=A0AAW1KMW3_POPJA
MALSREIFIFNQPHSDTCDKCDKFAILLKAAENDAKRREIETQQELHQRNAEKAVEAKRNAKLTAQQSDNNGTIPICFDLQKSTTHSMFNHK